MDDRNVFCVYASNVLSLIIGHKCNMPVECQDIVAGGACNTSAGAKERRAVFFNVLPVWMVSLPPESEEKVYVLVLGS